MLSKVYLHRLQGKGALQRIGDGAGTDSVGEGLLRESDRSWNGAVTDAVEIGGLNY